MVKSILIALTLGAAALLPQDAAANDQGHAFKHGHHHGYAARYQAPPPRVFHFGRPHKRWQHRPSPRYFGAPGYRAWLSNPARRHFVPPRHRGWAHGPARFKPRHHGRGWRW
jgi:hypothetical protein